MADTANVEIFQDDAGEWRWRVQGANGEIVATSEAYTRKADARRGWEDASRAFREAYVAHLVTKNGEDKNGEDVEGAGPADAGDADPAGGGAG
jgi:uncharacterized protein YegP (UPF0339 family)